MLTKPITYTLYNRDPVQVASQPHVHYDPTKIVVKFAPKGDMVEMHLQAYGQDIIYAMSISELLSEELMSQNNDDSFLEWINEFMTSRHLVVWNEIYGYHHKDVLSRLKTEDEFELG